MANCPECQSKELHHYGYGTERIEQALVERYPEVPILRIDRDTVRKKDTMVKLIHKIKSGEKLIMIGTQMLAKGHHFPNVTLVGILDADQGLFGADFRSAERMSQLILQVAGRAGRGEKPGQVLIQTHHPEHPLMHLILEQNYQKIAESLLEERGTIGLPPYSFMALLRAESPDTNAAMQFLSSVASPAEELVVKMGNQANDIELFGPMPAPMEKRAGRFRAQYLVQASQRKGLHTFLANWIPYIESSPWARKVRWSLDIDPQEIL
jgi:primosomal protein N' (replication factor Y)